MFVLKIRLYNAARFSHTHTGGSMKIGIAFAALFALFFVSSACTQQKIPTFGQDKIPSYFELDDYNHRHPETDTNVEMYMHSYKQSPVYSGSVKHGGWIEREVLFPGDPTNQIGRAHV